jgi:phage/plasmid-associated DNA primase
MGGCLIKAPKDISPDDFKDADALVNDWFEPDNAHYFKKLGGSFLQGRNKNELGHFFTGTGANGKTLAEVIFELTFGHSRDGGYLGIIPSTTYTQPEKDADSPEPNKLKQKGIRIGWTNETSDKMEMISANYCRVCDNSGFSARNLHSKEVIKVKPQFKNIVSTNYLARFTDDIVYATIRRIRVVPFIYTFAAPEHFDPNNPKHKPVDTKLKVKMPQLVEQFIMIWVYYFMIYQKEGLKPTKSMKDATQAYIKSLDSVKVFIFENIERLEDGKVWIDELYERYGEELEEDEVKMDKRAFIKKIRSSGYEVLKYTKRHLGDKKNKNYINNYVLTEVKIEDDE